MRITVAVPDYWLIGNLALENTRILDVLNDPMTDFVELRQADVHALAKCESVATISKALIPKCKIEIILVTSCKHEAPDKRWNNRKSKATCPAFSIVSQYCIAGNLHLTTNTQDSRQALVHDLDKFFAFTDATLCRGGKSDSDMKVPLLLANKALVNCFHVGEGAGLGIPVEQPTLHQEPVEQDVPAELLGRVEDLLAAASNQPVS